MYYSVNIPKSLMVYIAPQPSSEPWRILHNPLLAKVYIVPYAVCMFVLLLVYVC